MLIRIYYSFNNANGGTSWDSSLIDAEGPERALEALKKMLPSFALRSLKTLSMARLDVVHGLEIAIDGIRPLCKQFIEAHHEA